MTDFEDLDDDFARVDFVDDAMVTLCYWALFIQNSLLPLQTIFLWGLGELVAGAGDGGAARHPASGGLIVQVLPGRANFIPKNTLAFPALNFIWGVANDLQWCGDVQGCF